MHCLTSCNNLKIKLTPSCFQRFSQIGGETFPIFSLFFFILLKAFCARQYLVTGWWRLRESYLVNVPCLGKKRLIFIFARKSCRQTRIGKLLFRCDISSRPRNISTVASNYFRTLLNSPFHTSLKFDDTCCDAASLANDSSCQDG